MEKTRWNLLSKSQRPRPRLNLVRGNDEKKRIKIRLAYADHQNTLRGQGPLIPFLEAAGPIEAAYAAMLSDLSEICYYIGTEIMIHYT